MFVALCYLVIWSHTLIPLFSIQIYSLFKYIYIYNRYDSILKYKMQITCIHIYIFDFLGTQLNIYFKRNSHKTCFYNMK